jgi:hypothetical protein
VWLKYYGFCEWVFSDRAPLLPAVVTVAGDIHILRALWEDFEKSSKPAVAIEVKMKYDAGMCSDPIAPF